MVAGQARGDDIRRTLRLARLPHWVWVVEAHDRAARIANQPSVVAEFVFDSTSSDHGPSFNAVSMPGLTTTVPPDVGKREVGVAPPGPWTSQLDIANQ